MRVFFIILLAVVLGGCAVKPYVPTGACIDGSSIILTVSGGNPAYLDKGLLTVNFLGLEKNYYTATDIREFLLDADRLVNDGVTYFDLMKWLDLNIQSIPRYAGVGAIILGADIGTIAEAGGMNPLSACDVELIRIHIQNQRNILALYP